MPLIYTVSRAYQKVSSGALRQVYKGLAGTLQHRTFVGGTKFLTAAVGGFLVLSAEATSHFGKRGMFFCRCSPGDKTRGTDVKLSEINAW